MRASRAGKGPACGFQNKIAVLTAVFVDPRCRRNHTAGPSPSPSPAVSKAAAAQSRPKSPGPPKKPEPPRPRRSPRFTSRSIASKGVHKLSSLEVEQAVTTPFLGPNERTTGDVEKARVALQNAYNAKGFASVSVVVPPQRPSHGVIMLEAVERSVGQLRVNGAKYFSPDDIKKQIPSLAPGTVPDLSEGGPVQRDLTALNQLPDRRVTVSPDGLKPGLEPNTVDIDLTVQDKAPVHGSIGVKQPLQRQHIPAACEWLLERQQSLAGRPGRWREFPARPPASARRRGLLRLLHRPLPRRELAEPHAPRHEAEQQCRLAGRVERGRQGRDRRPPRHHQSPVHQQGRRPRLRLL